jgi:hypothetical protein
MTTPVANNAPKTIRIEGTPQDDQVKINKVQDGKLHYQIGEQKHQQDIASGDTIEVDLTQGTSKDGGDIFVIEESVDLKELKNYLKVMTGSGNDWIAVKGADFDKGTSAAKLHNVEITTQDGNDDVQFGEGVQVGFLKTDLGEGKNSFQVFNRYSDEIYRNGDNRFTDEVVGKIAQDRLSADQEKSGEVKSLDEYKAEIYRDAGMAAQQVRVTAGNGPNNILFGSYMNAEYAISAKTGSGHDNVTVMDEVEGKNFGLGIDSGSGMDQNYVGTRTDKKPVKITNHPSTLIDVNQAEDVKLTDSRPLDLRNLEFQLIQHGNDKEPPTDLMNAWEALNTGNFQSARIRSFDSKEPANPPEDAVRVATAKLETAIKNGSEEEIQKAREDLASALAKVQASEKQEDSDSKP